MTSVALGYLRPEMISDWINFNRTQSDWRYSPNDRESMAAKQTEGVAYLWNLLAQRRVALLADEVGMGKTFQALGVAALLWKMKPDARVLVMAPNQDLCLHWRREFNTLVKSHYRSVDHTVKNSVDGGPVPGIEICKSLSGLDAAVNRGGAHLYLTTIHSLSGLLRGTEDLEADPAELAEKKAQEIHDSLKGTGALGPHGFDLIIVDEAHYLRNISGGSQRVAAARAFFGHENDRLSQRALLLTATPSHTRLSDVASVFSYFLNTQGNWASEADRASFLLNNYGLRRMRLMEGRGKLLSKRHYRHEKPMPATFEGKPEAEGFFALYQKGLVAELNKKNENKTLMYGYLEGFESVGRKLVSEGAVQEEESSSEKGKNDYSTAPDTNLLMGLTESFYNAVGRFPGHPKYGKLIHECVPSEQALYQAPLADLKHLIFVRRIPSVRELTQRMNERYDELLGEMLLKAWGESSYDSQGNPRFKEFSRQEFARFMDTVSGEGDQLGELDVSVDDEDTDAEDEDYLASRVADLFVVKKGGSGQTDCANVRLRFTKPESLFSLFLEPASDYLRGGYKHFYGEAERTRANYGAAARYERFSSWSDASLREAVGETEAPQTPYTKELFSFWPLVIDELPQEHYDRIQDWAESRKAVAENFANYLRAGFLHASPVIVELYGWFVEYRRKGRIADVQEWYHQFYEFVQPKIRHSLMLRYFIAALETFETLCSKIIDHPVDGWQREWRSLKRLTSPAWYASGENNTARQRLILGFNSPFYPNVLVSTSVFQEGVNLHLNCHQIHHYGIAGSPGDNEQRVGRVDRLFGCVNKRLESGAGELSIHYPYLESSVDEDQVASFIERKHRVEERMDACLQTKFDSEYRPTASKDWGQFLRTPLSHSDQAVMDPYPAQFDSTALPGEKYQAQETHSFEDISRTLRNHLEQACDTDQDRITQANSSQASPRLLFIVDPVIEKAEKRRHQPIFMTLGFSPQFSALVPETAYIVSFSSPIANREAFKNCSMEALRTLVDQLSEQYPLVRVAIDEDASNSYFYLSTRVNFPLFVKHGQLQWLSLEEIRMGLENIKWFSDELEAGLFHGHQDLAYSDVYSQKVSGPKPLPDGFSGHSTATPSSGWRTIEAENGKVDRLCRDLPINMLRSLAEQVDAGDKSHDGILSLLRLNNTFPFVNFRNGSSSEFEAQLNFPAADFQDEERRLLEEWFQYAVWS